MVFNAESLRERGTTKSGSIGNQLHLFAAEGQAEPVAAQEMFPSERLNDANYGRQETRSGRQSAATLTTPWCCFSSQVDDDDSRKMEERSRGGSSKDGSFSRQASGSVGEAQPGAFRDAENSSEVQVLTIFELRHLARMTSNFSPQRLLGEGGFGKVYLGYIPQGRGQEPRKVAVKKLNPESFQGDKEFLAEIILLGQLPHPNIVHLIGYCASVGEKLLVYEFMPRGSLDYYLFHAEEKESEGASPVLPWARRLNIASQAASGLSFIHSNKVIHRDFKAANVLLDEDWSAKVTDFGLSRNMDPRTSYLISSKMVGSPGYLAPDAIMTGKVKLSTDVYAFGVLLLELVTGVPAGTMHGSGPPAVDLPTWVKRQMAGGKRDVSQYVDPKLRDHLSRAERRAVRKLAQLGLSCTEEDPHLRLRMDDVLATLRMYKDSEKDDTKDGSILVSPGSENMESTFSI